MQTSRSAVCFLAFVFFFISFSASVFANNLTISNVRMGTRDPSAKTLSILFDLAWDNSWKNKINHDAAWITLRLSDGQSSTSEKVLCKLTTAGVSPAGFSAGSNQNAEIYVPQDKVGAFIRPSGHQPVSSFSSKNVTFVVDYSGCGFSDATQIAVNVMGIEMVFVPQGSFYAGDFAASTGAFQRGSADTNPWEISGVGPISVTAVTNNGFFYSSSGNIGEFATGASFVIPQDFPTGFNAFYAMKYELMEGQWVDFINSLPAVNRAAHDLTDSNHKNTDSVLNRNTIACSGSPLTCATQRPSRAVSYLGWRDLCAFLDWAGLRPLTELEFEKAARGPFVPVAGEYAWGSTAISPVTQLSGTEEKGNELATTQDANAHFSNQTLTGGDASNGLEYTKGPLRAGIFSTGTSTRLSSGAGNYGMMELSGDLKEWTVSVGNAKSLAFTGRNGDGFLTTLAGYSGNADVDGWPGMDTVPAKGITSSSGAGFRGGSWQDISDRLRISDRSEAAKGADDAQPSYGGRGARTVDGQ
ncbi:MAG: SUMF1/EgtB/PvdO family nonheme iron enzyme [Candidatus Omnitrophica bacterium]|nr:SUMF1/EgtB/PvdO family nonheme iron enzyme [Candidatus Omnitrophota bacterium]